MDPPDLDRYFLRTWAEVIKQCENSLEPADIEQVRLITSWDMLQKELFDPEGTGTSKGIQYKISLLEPTLGHYHRFTQLFESQLPPGLQANFLWGIIGVLLQLTAQDLQALSKIPRMLKSLGYKVEAFKRHYSASTPENADQVKEACFDIQVQLVQFFTTTVKSLRGREDEIQNNKGAGQDRRHEQEDPWLRLQCEFTSTNQALSETLSRVENLVIALSPPLGQTSSLGIASITQQVSLMQLPTKICSSFFDRESVFEEIDQVLGRDGSTIAFRSIALFGLGGIGKSSIAARYIERKMEEKTYDAVFWIYGETTASLRQSFTDVALRLKLPGAQPNLHNENLQLVQNWFQTTDCKWLVVYDNVEDDTLLGPYWPERSHGKAIITTRNHNLVYKFATSGLEITSWDAKTGSEFLLFLLKDNIGRDIQSEGLSAIELAEKLSGHALGLSHMAGLIQRRSWSITEFMCIYLKDPRRLHKSELQAVWDVSFGTLERDSRVFLGVASFLVPDNMEQELFENRQGHDLTGDLEFFLDELEFSEAVEPLLALALMKRHKDARIFSCHRMVQMQFRSFLSLEERQQAFDNAVVLVYNAFPKQSDSTNKNQFYHHWTQCNRCLQHVLCLKDNFKEERRHSKKFKAPSLFCELLKDCQRYLYEINAFKELEDVCDLNLLAVETLDDQAQAIDIKASTLSHQASMYESIGRVEEVIELNTRGYNMRLEEEPRKGGLLGGFEQNLGYNYNTANQHETALVWFEKSRVTWTSWNIQEGREADWPTVTKKNTARCLMYLGRYEEAQSLLDVSIREFKQEKPLNWAMLAFTYFVQGILERCRNRPEAAEANFMEAQNMWFKGDQTRFHPFNAGCIYKTGVVCLDQGKVEAAIKHLRDALEITKFHSDTMPVEHARGLFKLSEALVQNSSTNENEDDGTEEEAKDLRDEAEIHLLRRDKSATQFGNEDAYDRWVPIFWR
ncbi:pfs domain-containing protein [Trichoderma pleuroticola]